MATPDAPSLTERKRVLARQRIVQAADELFAAQGFEKVSVTDIASSADVGRSTFFRYFGDKAEVVFAREQEMLEAISELAAHDPAGAARTAAEAIEQLRPIALELCEMASVNGDGYALHYELIEKHIELRARDALKTQLIGERLSEVLVARGTDASIAVFAGQVALACCQTGRRRAKNAQALTVETRAAFDQALALGAVTPGASRPH